MFDDADDVDDFDGEVGELLWDMAWLALEMDLLWVFGVAGLPLRTAVCEQPPSTWGRPELDAEELGWLTASLRQLHLARLHNDFIVWELQGVGGRK